MKRAKINCCKSWINLIILLLLSVSLEVLGQNDGGEAVLRVKIIPTLGEAVNPQQTGDTQIIQTGIVSLDRLNEKYAVTGMKRIFPYSPKYEARHKKHGLHLWYELEVSGSFSNDEILADYARISEVTKVELPKIPKLIEPQKPAIYSNNIITKSAQADLPFNDPQLDYQWHYNNYGQSGGTPGADIRLFDAWKKSAGSANIIVSVHDMGVDAEHEDLKDAMWVNEAELYGEPGVDDDGNGYIDDVYGYNFIDLNGTIPGEEHGTHTAGTIGATNNNGIGVSGVAGGTGNNDGVKIMSCRILGASTGTTNENIAQSYVYAADNGAVISQNSWGFSNPGDYSDVINDAIDYFIEEAGNYPGSPMKGGVVIFAVGNSNTEGLFYPAAYESCISVSALTSRNVRAEYSNYGDYLDIAAPGGDVFEDKVLDRKDDNYSNAILSTLPGNTYGWLDGTSMACPHVSGIAALIASKFQSSTFTNEELLLHMMTAYNDSIFLLEENEPYIGKIGLGAIDANLALATDNKIAPNSISDLRIADEAIYQDMVKLRWTVPADADDGKPKRFEVYYSEKEITAETLNAAAIVKGNNYSSPGDTIDFEVNNLKSVTNYHFAVCYFDRWGNKAGLSNILNVTTTEGPEIALSRDSIRIEIDVESNSPVIQSDSFTIVNNGEGILRWDLVHRHYRGTPYSRGTAKVFNGFETESDPVTDARCKGVLMAKPKSNVTAYNIEKDNDREYTTLNSMARIMVIGETNTDLPNSSATRFIVPDEEGFNLTHIDYYLELENGPSPVLQIFKGNDINTAELLLQQEITVTKFMFTQIELQEHLFFEYGESFWVVVHTPPGNLYPLGAGYESDDDASLNSYISFNYGKTWDLLADVAGDDQMAFAVFAMSKYKGIEEYVTLSPNSGELAKGESVVVVATVDGKNMVDGNYQGNVVMNTNETGKEWVRVPVNVSIKGHHPDIRTAPRIDFGSVVIGREKKVEFTIENKGLARFDVKNPFFTVTDSQFSYLKGVNTEFDALDSQQITFKFKPDKPGLTVASVTMLDKNGENYSFDVFGVGIEAPVAEVTPADTTYLNVAIGDTVSGAVVIRNNGKFGLDYYLSQFSDGSNMQEVTGGFNKFGYAGSLNQGNENPEAAPFNWTEISQTGTNITDVLLSKYGKVKDVPYLEVDFGFDFPFFGINESSVNITTYGMLTFDMNDALYSVLPLWYSDWQNADRYISALGTRLQLPMDESGAIYYQRFPDKFIVQYDNAPAADDAEVYAHVTFQFVLYENGNIYIYYKEAESVTEPPWPDNFGMDYLLFNTLIAIGDQNQDDGVYVADSRKRIFEFKPHSTVEFINPGLGLYYDLSKTFGSVRPGEADTITYKLNTDSLNVADYKEVLSIITSDPLRVSTPHVATINVTGGAVPMVSSAVDTLDFGQVFQGAVSGLTFDLLNKSKAPDVITSVTQGTKFAVSDIELPYTIGPKKWKTLKVAFETSELGVFNESTTITTQSGKTVNVVLKGEVLPAPAISVDPESITETLRSGEEKTVPLIVSNTGENTLDFSVAGNEWVSVTKKPELMSGDQENSKGGINYIVTKSTQENGPSYNWIELVGDEDAVKLEMEPFDFENNFSDKIEFPFAFNYYGEIYDSLIICASGFITFTDGQENTPIDWTISGNHIPNTDKPNNYIAPLWFGGGKSYAEMYPHTGVYYKILEDRMIVEYKDYINGFLMGPPMSFQVIIYDNGYIKFQYKFMPQQLDWNVQYGVIGIENQDGTEGIEISYLSPAVTSDMSILLVPQETHKIEPSESMEFDVRLDAKQLYQGKYTHNLSVNNNAPNGAGLNVPVTLMVQGRANFIVPDSIDYGTNQILAKEDANQFLKEYEIVNSGTAPFYITGLQQSLPQKFETEVYVEEENTMTGEVEWFWKPLYEPFDPSTPTISKLIVHAGEAIQMRTTYIGNEPGIFRDSLIVRTSVFNKQRVAVQFYGESLNPPIVGLDTAYFEAYAQSGNKNFSEAFRLNNFEGGSNLDYTIEVEYVRATGDDEDDYIWPFENTGVSKTFGFSPEILSRKSETIAKKSAKTELFNRVLAYENATQPESNLGFGGGYDFYAVTRFVAPEDGFNLTHVQTWFVPLDVLNSTFTVNIYSGMSITTAELVYTQDYQHIISAPDDVGELLTIELNTPVTFYPEENFFVEFQYGPELGYPQALAPISSPKTNTFFYGNSAQYYDMSENGFGDFAWIIRAAELEYNSNSWISLKSEMEGTLAPGEETNIAFDILTEYASQGANKALIHILSNDPLTPDTTVAVVLNHNSGPQFELSETGLSVMENDTISFEVSATDLEENEFTIYSENLPSFVSTQILDKKIQVQCTPDFQSAGQYTLRFKGEDEYFNSNEMKVSLTVLNKNRAPHANEIETIFIGLNEDAHAIYGEDLFSDPDDDAVSIRYVESNNGIFETYVSGNDYLLAPIEIGESTIKFIGTDIYGEVAENTVNVVVNTGSDISGSRGWFEPYPNPTADILNFSTQRIFTINTTAKVTNALGEVVDIYNIDVSPDRRASINVSDLTPGIYFITLENCKYDCTQKFVKK